MVRSLCDQVTSQMQQHSEWFHFTVANFHPHQVLALRTTPIYYSPTCSREPGKHSSLRRRLHRSYNGGCTATRRLHKSPMRNADHTSSSADPHQLLRSTPRDSRRNFSRCYRTAVDRYRDPSVGHTHVRHTPSHRPKVQYPSAQSNCWTKSTVPSLPLRAPHLDGSVARLGVQRAQSSSPRQSSAVPTVTNTQVNLTGSHPNRWAQVSYRNEHVGSRVPSRVTANC